MRSNTRSRFTPSQIRRTLRLADAAMGEGRTQRDVCLELGISPSTYRRWRARYGEAERRAAAVVEENAQRVVRRKRTSRQAVAQQPAREENRSMQSAPQRQPAPPQQTRPRPAGRAKGVPQQEQRAEALPPRKRFLKGMMAAGKPLVTRIQNHLRKHGPVLIAATKEGFLVASDIGRELAVDLQQRLLESIEKMTIEVPKSAEPRSKAPAERSDMIIHAAARKAAAISGSLALPGGAVGLITIIPDLIAIWKVQSQMVADVAATFGKSGSLNREHLFYCLFKHAASQLARDVAVRLGDRALLESGSRLAFRRLLGKVTFPFIGAAAVAGYSYFDTVHVGKTAVEVFENHK